MLDISTRCCSLFLALFSLLLSVPHAASQSDVVIHDCSRSLLAPPPKGIACGARGSIARLAVLQQFNLRINVFDYCRDSCFDKGTACQSFSVNTATASCRLFTKTISAQGFTKSSATTGAQYYEKTCFASTCDTTERVILSSYSGGDDQFFAINLPFLISFYGVSYPTIYMSINGFASFDPPKNSFMNSALPHFSADTESIYSYLPHNAILAYWDDLYTELRTEVEECPPTYVGYEISGAAPQRQLKLFWKVLLNSGAAGDILDFDMSFFEDTANYALVVYNEVDQSNGDGATIGMQTDAGGQQRYYLYSWDAVAVVRNTILEFKSGTGSGTVG